MWQKALYTSYVRPFFFFFSSFVLVKSHTKQTINNNSNKKHTVEAQFSTTKMITHRTVGWLSLEWSSGSLWSNLLLMAEWAMMWNQVTLGFFLLGWKSPRMETVHSKEPVLPLDWIKHLALVIGCAIKILWFSAFRVSPYQKNGVYAPAYPNSSVTSRCNQESGSSRWPQEARNDRKPLLLPTVYRFNTADTNTVPKKKKAEGKAVQRPVLFLPL